VIFTVTDLSKPINGEHTPGPMVAVLGVKGELPLHEYPEEYEDGEFVGAPDTWIAGLAGARPGIMMRAYPRLGTPSYFQGLVPKIEFADRARVYKAGEKTCVPVGCFEDVLVIDEWDPHEPDAHQLKYYAAGVGLIRVGWRGAKEEEKETLELTKVTRLDSAALAEVREEARKLEERAHAVQKELYGQTWTDRAIEAVLRAFRAFSARSGHDLAG
jgi:hypothetical protein